MKHGHINQDTKMRYFTLELGNGCNVIYYSFLFYFCCYFVLGILKYYRDDTSASRNPFLRWKNNSKNADECIVAHDECGKEKKYVLHVYIHAYTDTYMCV